MQARNSVGKVGILTAFLYAAIAGGKDMVVYKPDVLGVGRLFMVVLKVPATTPKVTVTVPACAVLLDRTPLPTKKNQRRYYFRTRAAAEKAEILFGGSIDTQRVVVDIWSFEQLRQYRKLKGVLLPRRWPLGESLPELKQGQTVTTEKLRERLRGRGPGPKMYLTLSDEDIWNMQPDSTIPRWHWTNVKAGCPIHGVAIYKNRSFYPWLNDRGDMLRDYTAKVPYTWKIVCPIDKAAYPSNDFAHDDFTSGPFPDDGIGGGCLYKGVRYGFIAETAQAYCHQMLRVVPACATGYLESGNPVYVHKALVALSRLAVEYAYLATMTQHRHRNSRHQVDRLGPALFSEGPCLKRSGLTVYCIDQPTYQRAIAEAYDRIWPAIAADDKILPFLRSKGFDLATHEDLRRFLEENLMAVWMQAAMDGATASNEPYAQWGLARMAEVLNYKRGTDFMDWLYDGAGNMRIFVSNSFYRDGAPYESSGGYNGMHVTAMGPVVEAVEHLRRLRPTVYPEDVYPNLGKSRRYHNVFDFSMDTVNIDRTYPRVGDDGSFPRYAVHSKRVWQNGGVAAFEHAYTIFRDPKFAWALAHTPGWTPSDSFPFTREQILAAAARWPDTWNDASRLSDGYGLAMLRSGKGRNKRALWMMYGRYHGHTHDDMLHMGLDAFRSEILGHLGYPRNWNYWTKCWMTQLLARQIPFVNMTATPQVFVDAGPVHLAEALALGFSDRIAEGEGYTVDPGNGQRRCLVLIDVDDEQFYCLDLYRVFGGREAWWTFHCQEDDGFRIGGDAFTKGEIQPGTLAGPDVPYGDESWLKAHGCSHGNYGFSGVMYGFPHFYHVSRCSSTGVWSADWTLKDADGLHFRLTAPGDPGQSIIVCDAKSPAGASPYEMKWLFRHSKGEAPLDTRFTSFMELYREQPVIREVTPLPLSGPGAPAAKAFRVRLASRTDTVLYSLDGAATCSAPGGYTFRGRFGLISEDAEGKLLHAVLIGGTELTRNGVGLRLERAAGEGMIVAVDRKAASVTVDRPLAETRLLVGKTVFVGNAFRRVGIKVLEVNGDEKQSTLRLAYDPCIGRGRTKGVADGRILTATTFYLRGFRYYHGARVVSDATGAELPVAGIRSAAFVLLDKDAPDRDAATLGKRFPRDSWFALYDYGVGDRVQWINSATVTLD